MIRYYQQRLRAQAWAEEQEHEEEVFLQRILGELQREFACEESWRTFSYKGSWWSCRGGVLARAPRGAVEGVYLQRLP